MDYFNQKASAVAKIIVADLRDIVDKLSTFQKAIDKHSETKYTADERNEQQQYQQPVPLKFELEENQERDRKTEGDRQYRVQNSIRKATWAAFCAAILYASIAALQWREAHKTMVTANRAWIGVSRPIEITKIQPGTNTENPKVTYVVTLKNYGTSVGLRVWITTRVVTNPIGLKTAAHDSCREALSGSNGIMATAGDPHAEHTIGDVMFPTDEYGRWFSDESLSPTKQFFIVGCVAYKDQFGQQRHTQFCNWYRGGDDITKPTPPIFLYSFFGWNDAD